MGIIGIYTTNRCNLTCKYCFANSVRMEINSKKVCLFVKEFAKKTNEKYINLFLTGGEPLLYKNLKELIVNLRDDVSNIVLLTNGILLTDEWMEFIEKKRIMLHVSLDSLNKEYHDKYRGGFEVIYKKLEKLNKYDINTTICMTMSHENIDEVENMISYTTDKGFKLDLNLISLKSDNPLAWANANHSEREKGIIQVGNWVSYTNRISKGKIMISFIKNEYVVMPVCYNKEHSIIINNDGQVYPCFINKKLLYGNIYLDSSDYIINKFNKYKTRNSKDCYCLDCIGMYD